ncbi:hypothetical protein LOTGIDRAFT_155473 [Lottia gigantea]|uniref:Uncharacterized protein n=1 Tax=Lottia gigantea TaxID=225164 RepID=V3Z0V5_LOTGI|nr:hypothetical protein LOTGIDRAFT_155473 [Lottia gigantea]ESO84148.1 hypothetical protein LOTGIDRAFT_155473 [Lottia gigantea]
MDGWIFVLSYIMSMRYLSGYHEIGMKGYQYRKFLKVATGNSMVFEIRNNRTSNIGLFDDNHLLYEFSVGPSKINIRQCAKSCQGTVVNVNTTLNLIKPTAYWIQWYETGTEIGLGKIVGVNELASRADSRTGLNIQYMGFSGQRTILKLTDSSGYSCENGLTVATTNLDKLRYTRSFLDCARYCKGKGYSSAFIYSKNNGACLYIAMSAEYDKVSDVLFPFNIIQNSTWKLCFHSSL